MDEIHLDIISFISGVGGLFLLIYSVAYGFYLVSFISIPIMLFGIPLFMLFGKKKEAVENG